jgi:uncharacterized protein YecA (UPF0149 family)
VEPKRLALLVATDSHQHRGFRQLRSPRADAAALQRVLEDPAVGGYSVKVLSNTASHLVNQAIDGFLAGAIAQDMVLLYFSGHGFKDDAGRLYFITEDSRPELLASTAVSANFVRERLDNCRSRSKIVLLDCCYAGAFPPGTVPRAGEAVDILARLGGRGSAVMTASSAIQHAFEAGNSASSTTTEILTPSVFTSALIDGLTTGNADLNGDGLIDFDELYEYVYKRVQDELPQQTPGRRSDVEGRLYVAVSPKGVLPTQLPSEINQSISNPLASVRLAAVTDLTALCFGASPSTLLAVRIALGKLRDDDSRKVAAAAQAALKKIDEPTQRYYIFGSGHNVQETVSIAGPMTTAERDIVRLRAAFDREVAEKTSTLEHDMATLRAATDREVNELKASAEREKDGILEQAKFQANRLLADTRAEVERLRAAAQREIDELNKQKEAAAMDLARFKQLLGTQMSGLDDAIQSSPAAPGLPAVTEGLPKGSSSTRASGASAHLPRTSRPWTKPAEEDFAKVGRNAPCPCGSGRRFKQCHGDPRNR